MENFYEKNKNTKEWLGDIYSEEVVSNFYSFFSQEILPAIIESTIMSKNFKKQKFDSKVQYNLKFNNYATEENPDFSFEKTGANSGTISIANRAVFKSFLGFINSFFEDEIGFRFNENGELNITTPFRRLLELYNLLDERRFNGNVFDDNERDALLDKVCSYRMDEASDFYYDEFILGYINRLISEYINSIGLEDFMLNTMFVNFRMDIVKGNDTAYDVLRNDPYAIVVDPLYCDIVKERVASFIGDYELGSVLADKNYRVYFNCKLEKLINAYYMELQRLEYYHALEDDRENVKIK